MYLFGCIYTCVCINTQVISDTLYISRRVNMLTWFVFTLFCTGRWSQLTLEQDWSILTAGWTYIPYSDSNVLVSNIFLVQMKQNCIVNILTLVTLYVSRFVCICVLVTGKAAHCLVNVWVLLWSNIVCDSCLIYVMLC